MKIFSTQILLTVFFLIAVLWIPTKVEANGDAGDTTTGEANGAAGDTTTGEANGAAGATTTGEANGAAGATTTGEANGAAGATTPGEANGAAGATTTGEANGAAGATTTGKANGAAGATTPGEANGAAGATTTGEANGAAGATTAAAEDEDGPKEKPKGKKKLILKEIFELKEIARILTIGDKQLVELDARIKEIINEPDVTLVQSDNKTAIYIDAEIIKEFDGTKTDQELGQEIFKKLNATEEDLNRAAAKDGFSVRVLISFSAESQPVGEENTAATPAATPAAQSTTTTVSFSISTYIFNMDIFLFIILSFNFFNLLLN